MIYGRFGDTSGRPYVEGRLVVPSLNIATNISFLVDTGADSTVLMPMDASKAGLAYTSLKRTSVSVGVGGKAKNFLVEAYVTFADEGSLKVFNITLRVMPPSEVMMDTPSLLGRNIIDRCVMKYSPSTKELHFDPVDFDMEVPIV